MEILLAIVVTLLSVGVLYLLGVVKELSKDVKWHENSIDGLRDDLNDLEDELYKLESKKGK